MTNNAYKILQEVEGRQQLVGTVKVEKDNTTRPVNTASGAVTGSGATGSGATTGSGAARVAVNPDGDKLAVGSNVYVTVTPYNIRKTTTSGTGSGAGQNNTTSGSGATTTTGSGSEFYEYVVDKITITYTAVGNIKKTITVTTKDTSEA